MKNNLKPVERKEVSMPYSPYVAAGTVQGPLHEKTGRPGADAFFYGTAKSGTIVIAVADGLGSAVFGNIGANISVTESVNFLIGRLNNEKTQKLPTPGTLKKATERTRTTLEKYADMHSYSIHDLATTLMIIAINDGTIISAHIGDGAIIGATEEGLIFISDPDHGEYLNEIVPLTSNDWKASLRIHKPSDTFSAVAVFTDGCEGASLEKKDRINIPLPGFFYPLFSYMKDNKDKNKVSDDITKFLQSEKMKNSSEDDKTLAIWVSE